MTSQTRFRRKHPELTRPDGTALPKPPPVIDPSPSPRARQHMASKRWKERLGELTPRQRAGHEAAQQKRAERKATAKAKGTSEKKPEEKKGEKKPEATKGAESKHADPKHDDKKHDDKK